VLLGEKPSGGATIQFIVDRTGRCRLARIVSATREEFGWAAATAVERWVFDPPRKKGETVDIRVSIPFTFNPPKE
jgi:TonB family protein